MLRRKEGALGGMVLALEGVANLFHRNPLHSFLAADVFNQASAWSALLSHVDTVSFDCPSDDNQKHE